MTYITEQRQNTDLLLLLDTGDAFIGGGILGDKTQGQVIVDGMNLMGYQAMALGPKDLAIGHDAVMSRMREAEFPILSANAVFTASTDLVAEPYTILKVGGHKIGIIGLTRVPSTPRADFDILDPQQALERYLPEVSEQATTLILLTNLNDRQAKALANAVPGFDLVIAALPGQLPNSALRTESGSMLVVAEQPVARHTGRRVGRLVVNIDSDGSLTADSWVSPFMTRDIPDDPVMKELLETYH